jgi:hypothetical protein
VRTDRQQYRVEEKVALTVEAYDENFEPLAAEDMPQSALSAEMTIPGTGGTADQLRELPVPLLRQGVFEAQVPVYSDGEYSIRVKDPITNNFSEVRFDVTGLSAERRSGVRNARLQEELAAETQGRMYDLTTVDRLADDLQLQAITEHYTRNHPLWSTPLWFIALVGLMLGEWFSRKMRRARAMVRAASAWSAAIVAVLVALAGVFVLDVLFELAVPQRAVVLVLAAAGAAWALWRFTWPLVGIRESEIDMALLVERQQDIDSDLVAALQFEEPQAAAWGSPQLETAVIDYVSAVGTGINVFEGFSGQQMIRRLGVLAVCGAAVLIAAIVSPDHLIAFGNRLLLGNRHYPTKTRIERVLVNEQPVLERATHSQRERVDAMQRATVKAPQGRPLSFHVIARGELPESGKVQLQATGASRSRTSVELQRLPEGDARRLSAEDGHAAYAGELPRLLENVTYTILLGDAWTDPALIEVVPLPIVETRLSARPPKYADSGQEAFDPSARQVAVLEGTSIDLVVECRNKKRLNEVWMTVATTGEAETKRYEFQPQDADGLSWSLAGGDSPLQSIRQELRYEIQVVDEDDLSLEAPLRGTIRLRPDRPPSGLLEVVHKVVLPSASPVVEYRASDDYGISRLALLVHVERGGSSTPPNASATGGDAALEETPSSASSAGESASSSDSSSSPAEEIPAEVHRFDLLRPGAVVTAARLPLIGRHALPLSTLSLAKGDRLKLTLEVTDYRGEDEAGQPRGTSTQSEPLVLEISDESGVLAAISEADQRSEERLTDIIKRQLGIGEAP